MKLTNKVREELRAVLRNAEQAQRYIASPRIAVCRKDTIPTTSLHYIRREDNGIAMYEVEKTYGSDLCGLDTAVEKLARFLATH